ncbi:LysR family transcriptional regulator [Saxibacter everestensis]|uniref:LysR family transcriptional regulator n=1 Tax=Saxibacter everestensis TaxID=2909229 RepID=A0ABY8QRC8_9MICO|nr:LysR family transcriptional regulator [Brevibacteriaceae bacterium ZFBP1038]
MQIDPRRLSFLLAVARHGGILAAAEALFVTPSAVSQQITRLEREQGVELLDRGPRGVELTASGRVLVEAAENIERELADARRLLAESEGTLTGNVVIGAFQTVIVSILAPMLPELADHLPGIDIDIREIASERLPRSLRAGEANLVILERDLEADEPAPANTREVPLLDEPWRLVVPADSIADVGLPELERLPWLGIAPGGASARAVERVKANLKLSTSTVHSYFDFGSALALVAAGHGVTLLPALAVQGYLPEGVAVIDLPGLGSRRLVVRHRATKREPSAATTAVIEAIVKSVEAMDLSRH